MCVITVSPKVSTHSVHLIPSLYLADPTSTLYKQCTTSSTIHRKHLVLVSQYETERKKSKRLRQDHLRQRGHRLVQLHYIHHLLFHRFGIAEAAWKTFSWTRDLNAEEFYEEAGHPVLTLKPVKLVKIFPQGLWQCAGIEPLLQHNLE